MVAIWAHRGASAHAPENTLPAFELAVDQGADGVELDVHLTADGHVVVTHDETIDRCSDGTGSIAALTLEQLRGFDFSAGWEGFAGTRIPTLREVYELLHPTDLTINVELKNTIEPYPGLEDAVEALTTTMNMGARVTYSSFNHPSLAAIARAGTQVRVAALHQDMLVDPWTYAAGFGASALHPYWGMVFRMPQYIERSHGLDLAVNVWTVNRRDDLERIFGTHVDAVITDHPDLAAQVRG